MKADAIKCQALPLDCVSFLLRVDCNSAACRGAGLNLISMLMVLTNVLWWRCHFWVDLNSASELNCTENYHIIAFLAVIYVHGEAGVHHFVGRGISAAAPTWRSAGWFSAVNIHLYQHPSAPLPPHAPFFFIHLFLLSWLLSSSHSLCFTLSVLLLAVLSLPPLQFPSSIIRLSGVWRRAAVRMVRRICILRGIMNIFFFQSQFCFLCSDTFWCDLCWAKQELVLLLAKVHLDTLENCWKDLLFL